MNVTMLIIISLKSRAGQNIVCPPSTDLFFLTLIPDPGMTGAEAISSKSLSLMDLLSSHLE